MTKLELFLDFHTVIKCVCYPFLRLFTYRSDRFPYLFIYFYYSEIFILWYAWSLNKVPLSGGDSLSNPVYWECPPGSIASEYHEKSIFCSNISHKGLQMFVLYVFLDRSSFIDPICCNFCMVLSMFSGWFWPIVLFSLRDINLTLGLLPPEGTWYGVILWVLRVLGQGLKS